MAGNFQNLGTFLVNAASSNLYVSVDRNDLKNFMLLIQQNYGAVGTPTGLTINVYDGYGNADPNATGGIPIVTSTTGFTTAATFTTSSVSYPLSIPTSGQKTVADDISFKTGSGPFYYNQVTRWIGLKFTNLDPTNVCTLKLLADI